MKWSQAFADLAHVPWKATALTLGERFREDRIALTASSLTFTTTMALVPFFTVALAVFTAFPMFGKLEGALQAWLVQSLVPDSISRQVLGYLTQFSGKASRLGAVGLAALFVSALALVLTIDKTLNNIWRVKRARPLGQRVLIYWAVMTLGPLLLAASLSFSSYVISASRGVVAAIPGTVQFFFDLLEFVLLSSALAALYRYVPNAPVRRSHAWAGGIFAGIGIELARQLLAVYLGKVPTYSLVYGAFATFPILLVWIYVVWIIVLLGAVFTAYMPSLLAGTSRRPLVNGWQFQLAIEVLRELEKARAEPHRGLSLAGLGQALQVEVLQLEPVMEALVDLDWVGRLNEIEDEENTRYLLLADVQTTPLEALMRQLLVTSSEATDKLWASGRLSQVLIKDVL
ncbi:YihY family inner membrane protein [Caenimonas koreensis]|uniref:YihY family inner membrane protein n=1 Tax=Caenimonas koreensis TaxID=367474 RepID=UPI003783E5B4